MFLYMDDILHASVIIYRLLFLSLFRVQGFHFQNRHLGRLVIVHCQSQTYLRNFTLGKKSLAAE